MAIDPDRQLGGSAESVNEELFDAMIRHQIGLLRVSGRVRDKILRILDATEADLTSQIRRILSRGRSPARLQTLQRTIAAIRGEAWTEAAKVWRDEILAIAKAEPEFVARAMQAVAPVQLDMILPAVDTLTAIVTSRPFEGRVLGDWARSIRATDIRRIQDQVNIGITQGESTAAISRRIVGTVRQRGRNGVTEITRRNAAAITRTAVNHVSNQAKRELFNANRDILEEELYVATLDSRTTPVCRSLDGTTHPVGEGPIPPLHFSCRSLRVALFNGEALGRRPQRQFTQRQLIREYNAANGTSARSRADLPRGHKGRFDDFARQRMRELTGTVDAKVTYQQFLERQSREFQDDVLGPTRGRLFRDGDLSLDRFVHRDGSELTLRELAGKEADAFRAAGLDPEDFT